MYLNDTKNDQWIMEHVYPEKEGGFFIEAGALDGHRNSCTYKLETELDWDGLLIEANTNFIEALKRNRNCMIAHACLGEQGGDNVHYIEPHNSGLGGIKKTIRHPKKATGKRVTKTTVTLESVLRKYHVPKTIHYLALDTEGSEFSILKYFPFDDWDIRAVSIESDDCGELMDAWGYGEVVNPFNPSTHERYYMKCS